MACRSRASGTSPTIAIVAACRKSATSGPVIVAPTITPRSSSIRKRPCREAAAVERASRVARGRRRRPRAPEPRRLRAARGVADGGHLGIGEDHAWRARAVGEVVGRPVLAEHVVGGDRRLVLGHVRERRTPVEVADDVQPVAAGDAAVRIDLDVAARPRGRRSPARGPLRSACGRPPRAARRPSRCCRRRASRPRCRRRGGPPSPSGRCGCRRPAR